MGPKKIFLFEIEPWEEEYFKDKFNGQAELRFYADRLSAANAELAAEADYLATFIYSDLTHSTLEQLKKLRGIATMSVGCDHIDVEEATRRGIIVSNVPSYGPNTVAEHTIALLLALSRRVVESVERTKAGDYDYKGLSGWDLMGKTIGIVGTGKIGSQVARICFGLGMKILANDSKPNPELTEKYQAKYVDLDQLVSQSDVITLHLPMSTDNKHLIGPKQFAQMKHGVVILNTARGGLIDTNELIKALESGKVAQAGLDVLEDEPLLKEEKEFFSPHFKLRDYQLALADHTLMHHPKVIITPHNAFNSRESLRNILTTTVENLEGMLEDDPVNVVSH